MILEPASIDQRPLRTETLHADLIVVGGGLSGTVTAIAAGRLGLKCILVQDRPVLGGNASSEVRLWVLGATSHMGNNNRWAREGGIMNEIMEENLRRNRHGNALIFDTILLEKVKLEENVTLLLNTAVYDLEKSAPDTISAALAFCSQNSTRYHLNAPLFSDCSGDGILGFMAGAAFRMGAESKEEFGEGFAPDESYGELLGHSLYFYTKDVGTPISFTAPEWALDDITKIPRYRQFNTNMQGCNFWWIEYGGRLDTIHDTEDIKWELWKVVYGVWDHIKNSGQFPDAETLTLEWVGHIPGKRESRRFQGDYMMRQQDVIDQTIFPDSVAHGGWAIDLHPADGVYSEKSGCTQWHSKGVYGIPYRSYYSENITNLFLGGRLISATHVAFGSTRVMATCAAGGQAVATAAALCLKHECYPREIGHGDHLKELQASLISQGQFLPHTSITDPADLAPHADLTTSSEYTLSSLPADAGWQPLTVSAAMLLPLSAGACPQFTLQAQATEDTELEVSLVKSAKEGNYTPEITLIKTTYPIPAGESSVTVDLGITLDQSGYHFLTFTENPHLQLRQSDLRVTGVLSCFASYNKAVATTNVQDPPEGIGVESFEFWLPQRRPEGKNIALEINPPLACFQPENLRSAPSRPTSQPNAWLADPQEESAQIVLRWDSPQTIREVLIELDPDWDHPLESVLMTHPEDISPFMVSAFTLTDAEGNTHYQTDKNHSAHKRITLPAELTTTALTLTIQKQGTTPPAVFRLCVY